MNRTDSHSKLERIRRAQDNRDDPTDDPEIYRCPIENCERVVIGNPGDLRNHVRKPSDDAHRYRTLNEDLEIETAWGEMEWGPGAPK